MKAEGCNGTDVRRKEEGCPFDARAGAAFFRTIGSLLYAEPTEGVIEDLTAWRLFDALPFETDDRDILAGQEAMRNWLASAPPASLASEARGEYLRLLVGVGEVLACPWASVYLDCDGLLFGEETLAVRAEFRRFGQKLKAKYREPDDHLGIELEFVGMLLDQGEYKEAKRFARERVLTWVGAWNADVQARSSCDYYRALGNLAEAGIRLVSEKH